MNFRIFLGLSLLAMTRIGFADVVVDDFNDIYTSQTTMGNKLGVLAHSGYWYGFTDSTDGGDSKMVPNVIVDNQFTTAVVPLGRDQSNCLHIVMTLGAKGANPYSAIGFNIKNDKEYVDLTAMTSLTLWAKGAGTVRVKFQTDKVTNGFPAGSNWGDMGAELVLTADWKQYTILPAAIIPQPYSPQATAKVTWDDCKAKVGKLIFQTGPNMKGGNILDLSLDDVVMTGVTPATFGGTWVEGVSILGPKFSNQNPLTSRDGKMAHGVFSVFNQGSFYDFAGRLLR